MFRQSTVRLLAFAIGVSLLAVSIAAGGMRNFANTLTLHQWMALSPLRTEGNLEEGLPPGWHTARWGAGRGWVTVVNMPSSTSLELNKTNDRDYLVVQRLLSVRAGSKVKCACTMSGAAAFVRLDQGVAGLDYRVIRPSAGTQLVSVGAIPSHEGDVALSIGFPSHGQLRVDAVTCDAGNSSTNLLMTPARSEANPMSWWRSVTARSHLSTTVLRHASGAPATAGRLMSGDFAGLGCDASSMLAGIGPRFEKAGGLGSWEALCDVAIAVNAKCSDGYRQKARLYSNADLPARAASLYRASAERASGAERGSDFFQAGMLELESMGALDRAVESFSESRRYRGWEPAPWYEGAADAFLVSTLAQSGRCPEARVAYRQFPKAKRAFQASVARSALSRYCGGDA
jgi:hypothetical protein